MIDHLRFHHLGVACRHIDAEARSVALLGYRPEAGEHGEFEDPLQGVRGRFMVGPGPRLELLEPLAGSTVLDLWLKAGVRIYHQAYEVADLDAEAARLTGAGARMMSPPQPAVAFSGRRVCFVMLRTMLLVELIEGNSGGPGGDGQA